MSKIRCIIVDDEPLALDLLQKYVEKTPFLQLQARCGSAFEAMQVLQQQEVELLFLDIQMPGLNGMEFYKSVRHRQKVIFTTAYEQYALEGFKVDALDYLLKPFNYEEFLTAATRAASWFGMQRQAPPAGLRDFIFVKSDYKLVKIDLPAVLYFEGLKDYVKIWLEGQPRPVLSLMSLKALEAQLPERQFMRVHRSFIVNLNRVETVERGRIVFGEVYIPVAEKYREAFQEFIAGR